MLNKTDYLLLQYIPEALLLTWVNLISSVDK